MVKKIPRIKNMKKYIPLLIGMFLLYIITITFISASLCKSSSGYYYECESIKPFNHSYQGNSNKPSADNYIRNSYSYTSSGSNYNSNYNTYNNPIKPIFKGSYGNYRYEKYASGDYNPPQYFISYGAYGYPSFFGGSYPYGGYDYYGYDYYPYYSGYYGYYDSYPYFSYSYYSPFFLY